MLKRRWTVTPQIYIPKLRTPCHFVPAKINIWSNLTPYLKKRITQKTKEDILRGCMLASKEILHGDHVNHSSLSDVAKSTILAGR